MSMSVDTTLSSHWSNVTRVVTYHLYLESTGDSAYCSCYAAQTHRDYTILRRWVSSGRKPGTCWFQSRVAVLSTLVSQNAGQCLAHAADSAVLVTAQDCRVPAEKYPGGC